MCFLNKKTRHSESLRRELHRELIYQSSAAAPGFFMIAAWVTYHHFETVVNKNSIQYIGLFLMLLAVLRYATNILYKKNIFTLNLTINLVSFFVFINAALWSLAFLISIFEYEMTSPISSITAIAVMLGLALSSLVSVAQSLHLAFAFQWILLIPNAVYLFYLGLFLHNESALHVASILGIALIYLITQTRRVHKQTIERIKYSLELQNTNKLLQESQNLLIEERAKLQHSTRLATLGEISGELAHEINNPLSIVQGNIELALKSLNTQSTNTENIKNKLTKAISSIYRITKIITGLRHLSRQTDQDAYLPVQINEIIEEALEFCSEKFNNHKIQVEFTKSIIPSVLCRSVEISQVLLNVFTNALDVLMKNSPDNRKIKIFTLLDKNSIQIIISNNGERIPQEQESKLFNAYFSTKESKKGSGLGLSISRALIESHNGKIYYDSSRPETTFIIELLSVVTPLA